MHVCRRVQMTRKMEIKNGVKRNNVCIYYIKTSHHMHN